MKAIIFSMILATLTSFQLKATSLYDCSQQAQNDEWAAYCEIFGNDKQYYFEKIGSRRTFYSFEKVSKLLSQDLERSYELIFIINAADPAKAKKGLIPAQHMVVLKKEFGKLAFKRDENNIITGIEKGISQITDITGSALYKTSAFTHSKNAIPKKVGDLELVPVSTGSPSHMLSFSGIFQTNYERSKSHLRKDWEAPMSHALYLGYYYGKPPERERISYAAIHGTPSSKWSLLGKKRDSHGCTRVHPAIMEKVRQYVDKMPSREVINLNWDYASPVFVEEEPLIKTKPVLIIIFEGNEVTTLV
jgi:hypothetical protein